MARSMINQQFLIQRETTPGTPLVNAMRRFGGIKGRVAWESEGDNFAAAGSKVNTARIPTGEWGTATIETLQDYNSNILALTGGYGAPASDQVSGASDAYEHDFELRAYEPDPLAAHTVIWGDGTQALRLSYFVFNSMSLGVERRSLSLDTGAFGYTPETDISLPDPGNITNIPAVPILGRSWNVYVDTTLGDIGETKYLAVYRAALTYPEKYERNWVINSDVTSYEGVIESENTDYEGEMRLGLNAAAVGVVDTGWQTGQLLFIRLQSFGPVIEEVGGDPVRYEMTIDACVEVVTLGEVSPAPGAAAVSLPFTFQLRPELAGGRASTVHLVNTVPSL